MADLKLKLPAKEILFPSHIIGIVVAHMWSYNLYDPLKRVLWGVVQAMKDAHSVCILSNFQLLTSGI